MNTPPSVWIVDDDASIRWVLDKALSGAGWQTTLFDNAGDVLRQVQCGNPDVIITDIRMPGTDGLELLQYLNERTPSLPVIVMTAHTNPNNALSAYQAGAFEYLPKPFDLDEAVDLVHRALEKHSQTPPARALQVEMAEASIIGEAKAMQAVFRVIGRLSKSAINVLICGETGTGKELVAGAIHRNSPRHNGPFVAINIAAIPTELLESELFGHEKGAFTGAHARREGRFEQARGGTLFLDEIGDMPIDLQTRLLRVLSNGTFYRLGGHEQLLTDVRIIAATNQDLDAKVRAQCFREDLYHRLNVMAVTLPPLRARQEDIEPLALLFLDQAARELGVEPKQLESSVLTVLARQHWPGNVRQLENLCRQLTAMAPGPVITLTDLPDDFGAGTPVEHPGWEQQLETAVQRKLDLGQSGILDEIGPQFERVLLQTALSFTHGRKQEAARRLGWGRNTLTRKLKELKLD
ncbi:MAG TPA: nitrogen regulation protein NR(I) [Gammaproteobacteria bacterium]|nr:nitrogen regulation protein NR(I) [Gammaproteobacteria bacterium]